MAKKPQANTCKGRKVFDIIMKNKEENKIKRETHNTGI